VLAATGGVLVLSHDTVRSGDPAPFELKGIEPLVGRSVSTGTRVPTGSARDGACAGARGSAVRRRAPECDARLPGGDARRRHAGAGAGLPMSYGLSEDTILHFSARARIGFGRTILPRSYDVTVGVLCRRPGASGSLADNPR
jgi:hypothetical protein